jgi:hypothetical protein
VFHRKFRVDRQPDRRAVFVSGQFDRKLDALVTVIAHLYIFRELLGCKHFVQKNAELPLAPATSCLHVCEHTLQSTNVTRQLPHRTKALMHLLQPITD